MGKTLHITFGFTGKEILLESGLVKTGDDEILEFEDPLSIAPLADIRQHERIQKRKDWLDRCIRSFCKEDDTHFVDQDLDRLQNLITTIDDYAQIQLWLGDMDDERIVAARLLYHLKGYNISISKVDFAKVELVNRAGRRVPIHNLCHISVDHAKSIAWQYEELDNGDRAALISLWELLRNDDWAIHTFGKAGVLMCGDESFYDQYLLARCTDEKQISSRIVGYALNDIREGLGFTCSVGDVLLFDRLNVLEKMGQIEITDRSPNSAEEALRLFNVRKIM